MNKQNNNKNIIKRCQSSLRFKDIQCPNPAQCSNPSQCSSNPSQSSKGDFCSIHLSNSKPCKNPTKFINNDVSFLSIKVNIHQPTQKTCSGSVLSRDHALCGRPTIHNSSFCGFHTQK